MSAGAGVKRRSASSTSPHAAEGIVVAPKYIEIAVVVNIRKVAGLHKHASIFELHARGNAWCRDVLHMDAVVGATAKHVLVAVIVKVSHAHAPLAVAAHRTEVVGIERALCRLVKGVQGVALVEHDQVVKTVSVKVRESHTAAAMILLRQEGVRVGE